MSRAQEAFDQLEAAAVTLSMCAMYCQQPEVFETFRSYWQVRSGISASSPQGARRATETVASIDTGTLEGAVSVMHIFITGYADQLRRVTDRMLDATLREACTHNAFCPVPGHPKATHVS